jgi:hypothetical protein
LPEFLGVNYEDNGAYGDFEVRVANKKQVGINLNCVTDFEIIQVVRRYCGTNSGCNGCEFTGTEDSVFCLTTNNLEDTGCCSNYEAAECVTNGGVWDEPTCTCVSPIVVDVVGNGFNLTNAPTGVSFDILNTGAPKQIA